MITRLLIAAAGAIIITAGLLLSMDSVTSLFRDRSGDRLFRITDILPKPPPGRPQRPNAQATPPERVELEFVSPDAAVPIELPSAGGLPAGGLPGPTIERPEALPATPPE